MGSFTGKAFANFYKNILGIDQTGNTGVDVAARRIQDGAGQDTSTRISTICLVFPKGKGLWIISSVLIEN